MNQNLSYLFVCYTFVLAGNSLDARANTPMRKRKLQPMTTFIKFIVPVFLLTLTGCGVHRHLNSSTDSLANNNDSIRKVEQYFRWSKKIEYVDIFSNHPPVLSGLKKHRDTILLLQFLNQNFEIVKPYPDYPYQPKDVLESTYAIDFNGDGLLDIIFVGPMVNGTITELFLHRGDHYEKVFSGDQFIDKIDFSDNRLDSFTLLNPGCCADPQFLEYYYTVKYSQDKISFILTKTVGEVFGTQKPQKILSIGDGFSVVSSKANLRRTCYIFDIIDSSAFDYGRYGNLIASYTKGAKGKVLGTKKEKGIEWLYVLMNSDSKIENCDYPSFLKQPTEIKGWILQNDTDWEQN